MNIMKICWLILALVQFFLFYQCIWNLIEKVFGEHNRMFNFCDVLDECSYLIIFFTLFVLSIVSFMGA